jgi:hypothetical protein
MKLGGQLHLFLSSLKQFVSSLPTDNLDEYSKCAVVPITLRQDTKYI